MVCHPMRVSSVQWGWKNEWKYVWQGCHIEVWGHVDTYITQHGDARIQVSPSHRLGYPCVNIASIA